ncbi:MAG: DNA mismatch repair endonuclease MutL [Bacteroidetes bacterium]|nr:DNA mismatch repair endonuclease MutL [Bacteroidota bacterium]MDA1121424.1 DNA mismatch repair endonuclease MutL [Bacteroidota bacterium]
MGLDIIHLLPDAIANQIAAGEVVQRPASVVKELLENSIDAGATNIQLIVKDAGKSLIQVIDNGTGMSNTDARMSLERHATSKIKSADDLFKIKTMGFRGEALPSIAAVAQVEVKTCRAEDELGTVISIEASELKKQEPIAHPKGTSISVKNLFYNVPARRNFLKSNPVELRHIIEELQRVALAKPEISFTMHQNDLETYHLSAGKLSHRVVSLFGKSYQEQLIPCSEETELVTITGYIGKLDSSKKTRGEQFFFVNDRFIKSNYLNHAVTNAYEGLIAKDYYPFYVLFIQIDPKRIDINVHPTKTEVKFEDERLIYGIIKSGVKQALGAHNVSPSLDFGFDVNFDSAMAYLSKSDRISQADRNYGQFKSTSREQSNVDQWSKLYDVAKNESETDPGDLQKELGDTDNTVTISSRFDRIENLVETETNIPFQVHRLYVLKQVKSGILLINQHAAHERILYERYKKRIEQNNGSSQQFLFPSQIEFNPGDFSLVTEMESEIKALGFDFEFFGNNVIVVNAIPADSLGRDEEALFEGLIEQFKKNQKDLQLDKSENLVRAIAKKSATPPGQKLTPDEMVSLIDQLFACQNANYTPSGNPTFVILDHQKIEGLFGR